MSVAHKAPRSKGWEETMFPRERWSPWVRAAYSYVRSSVGCGRVSVTVHSTVEEIEGALWWHVSVTEKLEEKIIAVREGTVVLVRLDFTMQTADEDNCPAGRGLFHRHLWLSTGVAA